MLDLVSTEELVEELGKRFDGLVVVEYHNVDKKKEGYCLRYFGGRLLAIGLVKQALDDLLNKEPL